MADEANSYEFNAPKHFFDFTKGDIEADETFFDTVSETPVKAPAAPHPKALLPEAVSQLSPKISPVPETSSHSQPKTPSVAETVSNSPKVPVPEAANQQTSKAFVADARCAPSPMSPRAPRSLPRRVSQAMAGLDTVGVRQSPRLAAIAKALQRNRVTRKSILRPASKSQENHRTKTRTRKRLVRRLTGVVRLSEQDRADLQANTSQKTSKAMTSSKPLKLTKPEEFHFATDSRLRGPSAAVRNTAPVPVPLSVKAHLEPTKPHKFHLAGDDGVKSKESAQWAEQKHVDFTRLLRSSTVSVNKDAAVSRTVPRPFNLTESRRRKTEEPSKFVSVAELNLRFQTKTPQRFRTKRAGSEIHDDAKRAKPNPLAITIPYTPQLTTRKRTRSSNCLSQQQIEINAFEEAQKHSFRARPVNKKVLEAPAISVAVERKLPTVPEPFNITDIRKAETAAFIKTEESGLADVSSTSVMSQSHGGKRSPTKVKPFSFDSRDKVKQQQKHEKIKKFIEDEKSLAEFHAQPMPAFKSGPLRLSGKKSPTYTQVQPFNLQADQRGVVKQKKFKAQVEEESHLDAERRKFRAQSGDVVHKAPFVPEKSQHPLTEISSFSLNTEVRAGKRSEYDLQRKLREEEILIAKKQEEERTAAEEAAEVAQLRQKAVHKANPAPKFKPVMLQLPQHSVTIPKSPRFATQSRLRTRSQVNSTFDISSASYTAE